MTTDPGERSAMHDAILALLDARLAMFQDDVARVREALIRARQQQAERAETGWSVSGFTSLSHDEAIVRLESALQSFLYLEESTAAMRAEHMRRRSP